MSATPSKDVIHKFELLRRELHEMEVDTDFQDVYLDVPAKKRDGRTFSHIVYQDLLHAYYYASRGGKAAQINPELCQLLLSAQTGKLVSIEDARKHIDREFYRFEMHEPGKHTPEFLTIFNDDEEYLSFIGISIVEVKKRWDALAVALVQNAPNDTVKAHMNYYLKLTNIAMHRFGHEETAAGLPPTHAPSQSTVLTLPAAKENPERYKNAAHNALHKKARAAGIPADVMQQLEEELTVLDRMPAQSPDYNNRIQPIVTLVKLPWNKHAAGQDHIGTAQARMHEKHAGLDKIKDIIVEHIAVQMRIGKPGGTILCLDGAPGVGKTSLAQTIAYAMGRPLVRIALGGMYDTAEICGHRSTYIGAKPGRIINGLLQAGVKNPVILLDEIDKIDHARGNLEATLLAVLDPEQNAHFKDAFVNAPFDLSAVVFIATSNDKTQILPALRDRMELIHLPAYTSAQKYEIARNHLLPRNMNACRLTGNDFDIEPAALKRIIADYAPEPGVRNLERHLKSILRNAVYKLESGADKPVRIKESDLPDLLTKPKRHLATLTQTPAVGVVNGLYVAGASGGLMAFEAIKIPSPRKTLSVAGTGLMKDSMKESLSIVSSWLRAQADTALLKNVKINDFELHVDAVMDGAKDGPSAGIAITAACVSTLTDKPLRHDIAMTGKMTLGGRVRAVGGILQKLEGAMKNGMKIVLIPQDNIDDLDEVSAEIKSKLRIIPVSHIDEVLSHAFMQEAQKRLTWDESAHDAPSAPVSDEYDAPMPTPAIPLLPAPR